MTRIADHYYCPQKWKVNFRLYKCVGRGGTGGVQALNTEEKRAVMPNDFARNPKYNSLLVLGWMYALQKRSFFYPETNISGLNIKE